MLSMKSLHANMTAGLRIRSQWGWVPKGWRWWHRRIVVTLLRGSQPYPSDFMFIDREVHGEALGDG